MIQIKEKKEILPVLKSDRNYVVSVPLRVQKEIAYLCKEINNVEWSGILYYTINDFDIELQAILPMDKGSSAYTEYDTDAKFITILEEKQKELGLGDEIFATWKRGHVH